MAPCYYFCTICDGPDGPLMTSALKCLMWVPIWGVFVALRISGWQSTANARWHHGPVFCGLWVPSACVVACAMQQTVVRSAEAPEAEGLMPNHPQKMENYIKPDLSKSLMLIGRR